MNFPRFSRPIVCGDVGCPGHGLVCGNEYDTEWLRPQLVPDPSFDRGGETWNIDPVSAFAFVEEGFEGDANCLGIASDGDPWTCKVRAAYLALVVPGWTYRIEAMIRRWTPVHIASAIVGVQWLDAGMSVIDNAVAFQAAQASTSWTAYSGTVIAPAAAYFMQVLMTGAATSTQVDRLRCYPLLDQRAISDSTGQWQTDIPTWAKLLSGDSETFTFDRNPSMASTRSLDNPVSTKEYSDGTVQEFERRVPKRQIDLRFSRLLLGYVTQLAVLYRKSRAKTLTYTDHHLIVRTVRWIGPAPSSEGPSAHLGNMPITLVEDNPGWL